MSDELTCADLFSFSKTLKKQNKIKKTPPKQRKKQANNNTSNSGEKPGQKVKIPLGAKVLCCSKVYGKN